MQPIPDSNYSPKWAGDTRSDPPLTGDERATLIAFLDYQRATLAMKCAGLTQEQVSQRPVPPSTLSLHGLIRHLTGCERWWFEIQFAGRDVPMIYYSDDDPDQDFDSLDGDFDEAVAMWQEQCERSRKIVAESDLDATGVVLRSGEAVSLRNIVVKMIAEYARHVGQADLLRERIDGATGF